MGSGECCGLVPDIQIPFRPQTPDGLLSSLHSKHEIKSVLNGSFDKLSDKSAFSRAQTYSWTITNRKRTTF